MWKHFTSLTFTTQSQYLKSNKFPWCVVPAYKIRLEPSLGPTCDRMYVLHIYDPAHIASG